MMTPSQVLLSLVRDCNHHGGTVSPANAALCMGLDEADLHAAIAASNGKVYVEGDVLHAAKVDLAEIEAALNDLHQAGWISYAASVQRAEAYVRLLIQLYDQQHGLVEV